MGALYDLQYMLDETWETLKLNKMEKGIAKFFRDVSHLVDASYNNRYYHFVDDKFIIAKNKHYMSGKPNWRKIK